MNKSYSDGWCEAFFAALILTITGLVCYNSGQGKIKEQAILLGYAELDDNKLFKWKDK